MKKLIAVAGAWSIAVLLLGAAWAGERPAGADQAAEKKAVRKKIDDEISIRPREAAELMSKREGLLLIDVRSASEFTQGALAGSQNVPFLNILEGQHTLPKDQPILLVCSIGGRSFAAGQILLERGYREIYSLDGGIADWQRSGRPVNFQGIITR